MSSLNEALGSCLATVDGRYGKMLDYRVLKSAWTELQVRKPPFLLQFETGPAVLHFRGDNGNLHRFRHEISRKNAKGRIASEILDVYDNFFLAEYVDGTPLNELPNEQSIDRLARLQRSFHEYDGPRDISYWEQSVEQAKHHLHANGMLNATIRIPTKFAFTQYGLAHGDYDVKNIVNAGEQDILIDVESVMYAPVAFDIARPLRRMCKSPAQRDEYLNAYLSGNMTITAEELKMGAIAFFLLQAHSRDKYGYRREALESLKHIDTELGESNL
jgi:hypothetical protein